VAAGPAQAVSLARNAGRESTVRLFAICLLVSSSALSQERPQGEPSPSGGAHFYLGPSLQLLYSGGSYSLASTPVAIALQGAVDTGQWMFGAELRAGVVRSPSYFIDLSGRVDRFLQSRGNSFYLGATFGLLDEADGENFGGDGLFAGGQAGFLWGRDRLWGRMALELQVAVPLFGERPNKPGDYVYPFATLGLRLLL
jgi:hypothetical protein